MLDMALWESLLIVWVAVLTGISLAALILHFTTKPHKEIVLSKPKMSAAQYSIEETAKGLYDLQRTKGRSLS